MQILTYHGSKGLEWPVVILASLDAVSRGSAFGTNVVAAPVFDPANPLAQRLIRFWPWPFGDQKSVPELDKRLVDRNEAISAIERVRKESHRLMYVGMTRARDGMVFVMRKQESKNSLMTARVDELTDASGKPLMVWPLQTGKQEWGYLIRVITILSQ